MAKKELHPMKSLDAIFMKFEKLYKNKFYLFNDSIGLTEEPTPKNNGDCIGTIVVQMDDKSKEIIRQIFYDGELTENKIVYIQNIKELRTLAKSLEETVSEEEHHVMHHMFMDTALEKGYLYFLDKIDFEYTMNRFDKELNRFKDKESFSKLYFLEDEDVMKSFIEDKNSIELQPTSKDCTPVIINISLIPFATEKTLDTVEYMTGSEIKDITGNVYYVTFHAEIPIMDIYITYHYTQLP